MINPNILHLIIRKCMDLKPHPLARIMEPLFPMVFESIMMVTFDEKYYEKEYDNYFHNYCIFVIDYFFDDFCKKIE